ncbi:thiamine phosphate synthase [Roseibium aestuarii]|uniref:Thiamine phosphate synthase n=1 Tax=Roseibium aestuarii TaxID=2600299 RepID=A0ABW4JYB8_9HYPH|nr:thiamine phosphate synthase [Roseibium aestuarii]
MNRPRLFLVTPPAFDLDTFVPSLEAALSGGDVACVLIYRPDTDGRTLQTIAERLVPIIQGAGAAALIYNDTQVAGRCGADGAHVDTSLEDLKLAVESLQPAKIVGGGGTKLKHDDMEWAETGIDYLFIGRLDLEEKPEPHDKTLSKAQWWAELFETPCVALAGSDIESVDAAAATVADFVAVKDAVWTHADGPAAAVARANAILDSHEFPDAE